MDTEHGLYPLKFAPILKERIWGGSRLGTFPGKTPGAGHIGESWELSGVQGDISVVKNGFLKGNHLQELIEVYMGDLVGEKVYERFGVEFPVLVKLIDAQDDLSIQVHPNDTLAAERHHSYGKTEMWYVMEAGTDSRLIVGFNRPMDRETYLQAVNGKTLTDVLNVEKVREGDVFFIPAGRIHAICKNILIAEIQQTSDITYRIYDWDRTDANGKSRELHTELATDAIDYTPQSEYGTKYDRKTDGTVNLVQCPCFTVNMVRLNRPEEKDYRNIDSFVIYTCVSGACRIEYGAQEYVEIGKGETALLPATLDHIRLVPSEPAGLLETYIIEN
ncbi:MAG: class I mannose-6-phosphate isomerase [Bacteroidales bacterium]|jgi:mannose-6-phosphate isomerase|nr:class I mannose-6-phosphate isomerase [Bacteroidales bacterium]